MKIRRLPYYIITIILTILWGLYITSYPENIASWAKTVSLLVFINGIVAIGACYAEFFQNVNDETEEWMDERNLKNK